MQGWAQEESYTPPVKLLSSLLEPLPWFIATGIKTGTKSNPFSPPEYWNAILELYNGKEKSVTYQYSRKVWRVWSYRETAEQPWSMRATVLHPEWVKHEWDRAVRCPHAISHTDLKTAPWGVSRPPPQIYKGRMSLSGIQTLKTLFHCREAGTPKFEYLPERTSGKLKVTARETLFKLLKVHFCTLETI